MLTGPECIINDYMKILYTVLTLKDGTTLASCKEYIQEMSDFIYDFNQSHKQGDDCFLKYEIGQCWCEGYYG